MNRSPLAGGSVSRDDMLRGLAALLTAAPPLLAYNLPPSPTLINQCLAFGAWGGFVLALAPGRWSGKAWPLQAALLGLVAAVWWSWGPGLLPASLALSALAQLLGAMLVAWAGTEVARRTDAVGAFVAFAWGLLAAGVASTVVAFVQVFLPSWADGNLIAHSGLVGRAVGNLRQPNHLCSLLLWAVIAAIALLELRRLSLRLTVAAVIAMVFAIELTASRTGAGALLLLAAWGLLGRRLSRPTRWLLVATPVIYALSFGAMWAWGEWVQQAFGAEARLAGAGNGIESPNTRGRIWANALAMIAQQPWTGVGFGEFNLAWSLTEFPQRPTAFFDHTHTLPLQLAVELGLPLSALVMGLLLLALARGWQRWRRVDGDRRTAASAAWMIVLGIGVHSMVEYPLWYAYFLLPAAFAWGYTLGIEPDEAAAEQPKSPSFAGQAWGAAMVLCAALALVDYARVVVIYAPGADAAPLAQRIERGQRSLLFSYQGDYAAATSGRVDSGTALAFERAPHFLMDTRLMMAWAKYLHATGRDELARSLVLRLREFRNADAKGFLDACLARAAPQGSDPNPASAVAPALASVASGPDPTDAEATADSGPDTAGFQCQPPARAHPWREFLGAAAPQLPAPATQ
ncbi:MAG: O-antigen ligase C-terminal domain-containing protein [Ideonella sp.]|nr:O-antigen ligase C-terminal domain-containing protein [Ideonella sp.]